MIGDSNDVMMWPVCDTNYWLIIDKFQGVLKFLQTIPELIQVPKIVQSREFPGRLLVLLTETGFPLKKKKSVRKSLNKNALKSLKLTKVASATDA